MRRHAFLGRGHEMERKNPLVERDFAVLHHGSDRDAKGRVALVAPVDAGASGLAGKLRGPAGVGVSAMTTDRAVWPVEPFQMLAGLVGVCEDRVGEIAHRSVPAMRTPYHDRLSTSSI